jgi:hypothetical protein
MFGHLKPEEFINAVSSDGLQSSTFSRDRLAHLNSCPVCMAQLRSIQAAHTDLVMEDQNIPEPDWNDFRDSVRLELLARSIHRQTTIRRWTGWAIRPAMAWGLSFVLLIGISVGGFLWHMRQDVNRPPVGVAQEPSAETPDSENIAAWTGAGVFQELSNLEEPQLERLRALVESAQNGVLTRQ